MAYQSQRAPRSVNPLTNLDDTPPLEIREGRPVRVKAVKAFYVAGRLVEVGEIITIGEFDALSLRALGRAEIVKN